MHRTIRSLFFCLSLLSSIAWGQTPAAAPPMGSAIQGKVQALNGSALTLTTNDGKTTTVTLPANVDVQVIVNKTLADIKEGELVGSAAKLGADGKLHAEEVHFIPQALKQGIGHRQMGEDVNRSMTNANVTKVARNDQGLIMTLQYPGGTQEIVVAADTPVTGGQAGNVEMLKPGVEVTLLTAKDVDGNTSVRMVRIGSMRANR